MAREGQGYPRWRRDMMMMKIYICVNITSLLILTKSSTIFFFSFFLFQFHISVLFLSFLPPTFSSINTYTERFLWAHLSQPLAFFVLLWVPNYFSDNATLDENSTICLLTSQAVSWSPLGCFDAILNNFRFQKISCKSCLMSLIQRVWCQLILESERNFVQCRNLIKLIPTRGKGMLT